MERGFVNTEVDFLKLKESNNRDIITNPPYKFAMLLKLQFLEGQNRRKFFEKFPPLRVYVFLKRIMCAKNGNFEKNKNPAIAYTWYIWVNGKKRSKM